MTERTAAPEKRKWVRLTRACNNRCLFCLDADSICGEHLPLGEIEADLRRGRAEGCRRVVLSGGEPTIHPKFTAIVAKARKLGYTHVQAISNGRMFCYDGFLKRAVAAGLTEITFSVHGATSGQHDALVGVPGAFAQTLLAIANAKKVPGLIVSSDIVVNRLNADSVREIVGLLHRLGVDEYDLLNLIPFGRAWENWKKLSYDPASKRKVLEKVFRFSESVNAHVWTNRFPAAVLEGNERYIQHPGKLMDEVRGMRRPLEAFLYAGEEMHCKGARCASCVMAQFCSDLELLRAEGSLKTVPAPACLPEKRRAVKKITPRAGLMKVAEFFIAERLTVKGSACRRCRLGPACRGARIWTVMARGFSALKPVRSGRCVA
ncbi:MAG: radical SAM protein [Elusimicrobia bacterium]|nr:radical SAM protein [Elusimicrobiota bacterium]